MTPGKPIGAFDGHNDVLLRLFLEPDRSFLEIHTDGQLDLPRARQGGIGGGLFAVYVPPQDIARAAGRPEAGGDGAVGDRPADELNTAYARRATDAMMAHLVRLVHASRGEVVAVHGVVELERALQRGAFAAVLHFEGAEAIDPDLEALEAYYKRGLRSLGLVHSRPNVFAHGVPFLFPHSPDTGPGLTEAGRNLIRACNRLGIMIDLSHLNEKGFWHVASLTDAPLVATHSNAHALTPSTRNLTDRQLDAIRETDGIVGLNFHVPFLRSDGERNPDTPLEVLVRHLDYLVERLGIERVGFGSDFEYALLPDGMPNAAFLPCLLDELRRHGYDTAATDMLRHANWLRVLRRTWKE